tara:strand:+ start:90 stop:761 length:672 start_codon:yes stop_codon:yes gene_type:complete
MEFATTFQYFPYKHVCDWYVSYCFKINQAITFDEFESDAYILKFIQMMKTTYLRKGKYNIKINTPIKCCNKEIMDDIAFIKYLKKIITSKNEKYINKQQIKDKITSLSIPKDDILQNAGYRSRIKELEEQLNTRDTQIAKYKLIVTQAKEDAKQAFEQEKRDLINENRNLEKEYKMDLSSIQKDLEILEEKTKLLDEYKEFNKYYKERIAFLEEENKQLKCTN